MFGAIGSHRYLDYAKDIWASGQHLLPMIDNVLELAESESGRIMLEESEFDISALLVDCRDEFASRALDANVQLSLESQARVPHLRADRRRVRIIVQNLLSNAIKFTPPGGAVTLAAYQSPAGGLCLRVADTGTGIAAADIEKVVLPFNRARSAYHSQTGGAGLGLSAAKALAAMHDATLEVASPARAGTEVTIAFPPERARRRISDDIAEAIQLTASGSPENTAKSA